MLMRKNRFLSILNSTWFSIISVVIMAVILFTQADHKYGYTSKVEKQETCIKSDGTGYYVYLPQYIVYKDKKDHSFVQDIQKKNPGRPFFEMMRFDEETFKISNKFYIGTALLQSPFYLIAHKLHQWNHWDADGYQLGYRASIQISALFYWLVGVFALFKLFSRFEFSRISILMGIVIVTFGTNLNEYVSYLPTMSHAYSFSMVACFLNVSHLWVKNKKAKHLLLALFLLGLITAIRPINFLVILIIPFFFDSLNDFFQRLKLIIVENYLSFIAGIIVFFLPIALNLLVIYDQTGQLKAYTYSNEGFANAAHPEFLNVLFSYHKGFFIYAPVMLILFIAFYFFFKYAKRYFFIGWFICILVWLYAISSWWCWDYGGGLGMRAMIEFLPLLLFPILFLFKHANRIILTFVAVFSVITISFYQLFQFQHTNQIIHCCEMDKTQFWNAFMKTDERFRWMIDFDLLREHIDREGLVEDLKLEKSDNDWNITNSSKSIHPVEFHESNPVFLVDSLDNNFKAITSGKIKLNDKKINPFIAVEYFRNDELIENSVLTIGSRIDNPFEFEQFSIEINHDLKDKGINKVMIVFHDGGGAPIYKDLVISKFK